MKITMVNNGLVAKYESDEMDDNIEGDFYTIIGSEEFNPDLHITRKVPDNWGPTRIAQSMVTLMAACDVTT